MAETGNSPPHAIGIGAQKAGSSWVFDLLALHPKVAVAAGKGTRFLHPPVGSRPSLVPGAVPGARAAVRKLALLSDRSAGAGTGVGLRAVHAGDRDPARSGGAGDLAPPARGRQGAYSGNFLRRCAARQPRLPGAGLYARHLRRWLEVLPAQQMLVLIAEEMRADPAAAARRIHAFLGLGPGPVLTERRHVSDRARLHWLRRGLRLGGDGLRRAGAEPALLRLKAMPPVHALLRWNSRDLRQDIALPDACARAALAAQFSGDMADLARMLGRDSLPWPSFAAVSQAVPAEPRRRRCRRPRPAALG